MEDINGSETRRRVNWKRKGKLRWKLKRKNVGFEERVGSVRKKGNGLIELCVSKHQMPSLGSPFWVCRN